MPERPHARRILGGALLAAGVALAAGAGALQALREAREGGPLAPGSPAPDLAAPRLDGTPLSLTSLRGRVVLLSFFATWCGPCAQEMPALRALARERGPQGVELVVADVDDPEPGRAARVAGWLARGGEPIPPLVFPADEAEHTWRAEQLPTLYVIGRDGRIAASHVGLADPGRLAREVDAALAAMPPAAAPRE